IEADGRRYFAPATLDQAADLLAQWPEATLLAGGTDVGLWVTKLHKRLDTVIYLGDVVELNGIVERPGHWWIGAGATYNEALAAFAGLHPDLAELVRRIGSLQIRNAGTLGGNIGNASPIGDSMPALIALGAQLHLRRGAAGRVMPIEDYFLGYRRTALQPGELIVGVEIPKLAANQRFATYKVSKRFDQDISAVCPAYRLTLDDQGVIAEARIAHGGMAAIPARAPRTEAALTGRPWTAETVAAAMAALADDYAPIDDMRASAGYRLKVARNLLRRFHLATTAPQTRVHVLAKEVAA
ncbi:MAG: FAD binding domain-containing protein, partial [Ferrovibrionaceae bacterium]